MASGKHLLREIGEFLIEHSGEFRSAEPEFLGDFAPTHLIDLWRRSLRPALNLPDDELLLCQLLADNTKGKRLRDDLPIAVLDHDPCYVAVIANNTREFAGLVPYGISLLMDIHRHLANPRARVTAEQKFKRALASPAEAQLLPELEDRFRVSLDPRPVDTIKKALENHQLAVAALFAAEPKTKRTKVRAKARTRRAVAAKKKPDAMSEQEVAQTFARRLGLSERQRVLADREIEALLSGSQSARRIAARALARSKTRTHEAAWVYRWARLAGQSGRRLVGPDRELIPSRRIGDKAGAALLAYSTRVPMSRNLTALVAGFVSPSVLGAVKRGDDRSRIIEAYVHGALDCGAPALRELAEWTVAHPKWLDRVVEASNSYRSIPRRNRIGRILFAHDIGARTNRERARFARWLLAVGLGERGAAAQLDEFADRISARTLHKILEDLTKTGLFGAAETRRLQTVARRAVLPRKRP